MGAPSGARRQSKATTALVSPNTVPAEPKAGATLACPSKERVQASQVLPSGWHNDAFSVWNRERHLETCRDAKTGDATFHAVARR